MNKIGSTRIIEINNTLKAKSGLPFLGDEFLGKAAKMRLVLQDDETSNLLSEWDDSLLCSKRPKEMKGKVEKYDLVKKKPPYHDQCYAKLRLAYDTTKKHSTDELTTVLVVNKQIINDSVSLAKLNEYLTKANKWKVTLRASSAYTYKTKRGINYMVDRIELL